MRQIYESSAVIVGIDCSRLEITYDNMGEPYREGIRLSIHTEESASVSVLLYENDVELLQQALHRIMELFEEKKKKGTVTKCQTK